MKIGGILIVEFAKTLAFVTRNILRLRYRVILIGSEVLDKNNSMLVLPNHQALIDPIILISNMYRYSTVLPAISSKYYDIIFLKAFFKNLGAIRVSDLERGSRDVNVLKDISRAILKGLKRGKSMVLYPSGQIANQGFERIANKKSAHVLVSKLPQNSEVIGVRIHGLWGSMWSKAKTGASPDFFLQFLKGIFYIFLNLIFFIPKRKVEIEFFDITEQAKESATKGRKEFNQFLEEFYNSQGEEPALSVPYFFLHFNQ
jgi:1-acyl-sn-glycerol-3-phosphate acyltransferase